MEDGALRIGATATFARLATHQPMRRHGQGLTVRKPPRDVLACPGRTTLRSDQIIAAFSCPALGDGARSTFAKIGSRPTFIEYHGDSVAPMDLPDERRTLRGTHARVVHSDKASEPVASSDADLDVAIAVHEVLFGAAWHDRPRGLIILNTSSPLQITGETARILVRCLPRPPGKARRSFTAVSRRWRRCIPAPPVSAPPRSRAWR
jgi:CO/xanthine dehydrogenase FAD-binding subunit